MTRVIWRIVPFLMVCYFIAFVDRVNAGFAALQMNKDIGLSHAAFGLGGGLFYITYVIFEIPSNSGDAEGRRPHLDRPHPGHLGAGVGWDGRWSSGRTRSTRSDCCSARRRPAFFPASSST